jgi:hypothetical protein
MIVKSFKTYVPSGNLGLSSGEVGFSLGNNHVSGSGEKEFKLLLGAT